MGKSIKSREILLQAKQKAKSLKLEYDCHDNIEGYSIIEQMLYFCFLNLESLYHEKNISKETKNHYEVEFEKYAQEIASIVMPMEQNYIKMEHSLHNSLQNNNHLDAINLLASMLDYSRAQVFEGKYTALCNHYNKYEDLDD